MGDIIMNGKRYRGKRLTVTPDGRVLGATSVTVIPSDIDINRFIRNTITECLTDDPPPDRSGTFAALSIVLFLFVVALIMFIVFA